MAKNLGAQIEEQISNARHRKAFGKVHGIELFEAYFRLGRLSDSLRKIGSTGDSELFRHFPVAAIAALEGHFKEAVAGIVNTGSPYLERGLTLAKDKLKSAADIVPLLHRSNVSLGDVIAHLIPFNSVSSIEKAFNDLLEEDFKSMISKARDSHAVRSGVDHTELLVPSISELWRELTLAFERRHILAHEGAAQFELSFQDAQAAVEACTTFTRALDAVLWTTVWKDVPLTQSEMNVVARSDRDSERLALARVLKRALAVASKRGERERFRKAHSAWKNYQDEWRSWEIEPFEMASMRPMIAAESEKRALQTRRESVESWLNLVAPDPNKPIYLDEPQECSLA